MFLSFVNRGHGNSFPSEQSDPFVGWLYFRRQFFFFFNQKTPKLGTSGGTAQTAWTRRPEQALLAEAVWPERCGHLGAAPTPAGTRRPGQGLVQTSPRRGLWSATVGGSGSVSEAGRGQRTPHRPHPHEAPCAPVPWVNTANRDVRRPRCQLAPAFSTFFESSLPCGIVSGGNSHAVHGASVLRPLQVSPTGARHRTPRPSNLSPSRL